MANRRLSDEEIDRRGQELYRDSIRSKVETDENIGKIIVIDVQSGDFEIDDVGYIASYRVRARHPNAELLGLRIGYDAVEGLGGGPARVKQ